MHTTYRTKIFVSGMILSLALSSSIVYGTGSEVPKDKSTLHKQIRSASRQRIQGLQQYWQQYNGHSVQEPLAIVEEASTILGIKAELLTQMLQQGKSIADIAKEQGQKAPSLIDNLLSLRIQNIDIAIVQGKLTFSQAELMKTQLKQHLTFMVYRQGLAHSGTNNPHKLLLQDRVAQPRFEKLAAIIGLSPQELTTQLNAGKTMSEIAQSKGITKEMLQAKITEQLSPTFEQTRQHQDISGNKTEQ